MKKKISLLLNSKKEIIKKISLTLFIIALATLILIFGIYVDVHQSKIYKFILSFVVLLFPSTLFIETTFERKKIKGFACFLSLVLSLIMSYFMNFESSDITKYTSYISVAYFISFVSASIYSIFIKSKISFQKFIYKISNNIVLTSLTYMIIFIGSMFLYFLFDTLIYSSIKTFSTISLSILGFFYFPALCISITEIKEKKISLFYKGIIKFILFPMFIISITIIYLYLFKILITLKMPNNMIFGTTALVFIFGIIIYFITKNEELKISKKINIIIPYLYFIPIMIQIYSVIIRYMEYGLTPSRILSYLFILIEIITLLLIFYKKGKYIHHIFVVIASISLLSLITPFNIISISNNNQKNILNKYYNSEKNYNKAYSAYNFLQNSPFGKKFINKDFKIKESYDKNNYKRKSIYLKNKSNSLNITNYKELLLVKATLEKGESNLIKIPLRDNLNNNSKIEEYQNKIHSYINMKDFIQDILSKEKNNDLNNNYLDKNNIVKIDDNSDLYIISIDIFTSDAYNTIHSLSIDGYLLKK